MECGCLSHLQLPSAGLRCAVGGEEVLQEGKGSQEEVSYTGCSAVPSACTGMTWRRKMWGWGNSKLQNQIKATSFYRTANKWCLWETQHLLSWKHKLFQQFSGGLICLDFVNLGSSMKESFLYKHLPIVCKRKSLTLICSFRWCMCLTSSKWEDARFNQRKIPIQPCMRRQQMEITLAAIINHEERSLHLSWSLKGKQFHQSTM